MTQQEQFEAWLSINTPCCSEYNRQQIEWLMWQAWQASRAAIVVKLPELKVRGWVSQETIEGYKTAIDEVKHALDDAEVNYE